MIGILTCAKYAFKPNQLKYCGGKENAALFELTLGGQGKGHLTGLLAEFETLMPYLKLIAKSNNIRDPFDPRVVEAYWIGNELLEQVKIKHLYNHFVDGLKLKRKMSLAQFEKVVARLPGGGLPHHSFHVFNVWLRTGNNDVAHTLESMNSCRIGWGKVVSVGENELTVKSPQLSFVDYKLQITNYELQPIIYKQFSNSFIQKPEIGNWISFHWGWACDKLTERQVHNLQKYTLHNLQIANRASND